MVKSDTSLFTASTPPKIPTTLAIREATREVLVGKQVQITFQLLALPPGEVSHGLRGKNIRFYVILPSGSWERGADYRDTLKNTGTDGYVTYVVPGSFITEEGDYQFYAEFLGDAEYEGCDKEELTMTKREPRPLEVGVFEW